VCGVVREGGRFRAPSVSDVRLLPVGRKFTRAVVHTPQRRDTSFERVTLLPISLRTGLPTPTHLHNSEPYVLLVGNMESSVVDTGQKMPLRI
jgi:hypothetical protein